MNTPTLAEDFLLSARFETRDATVLKSVRPGDSTVTHSALFKTDSVLSFLEKGLAPDKKKGFMRNIVTTGRGARGPGAAWSSRPQKHVLPSLFTSNCPASSLLFQFQLLFFRLIVLMQKFDEDPQGA